MNHPPVFERDGLARLQPRIQRPFGNAQRLRAFEVEPARLGPLFEPVSEREYAMVERARRDCESGGFVNQFLLPAGEILRVEFAQLERVIDVANFQPGEQRQIFVYAGRADQRQLFLALVERHRRKQAWQAVEMVAVQMRDEHAGELLDRKSTRLNSSHGSI